MINLITTSSALADFCALLHQEPFVAIDTEFVRQRTYWPIWGLLQLATPTDTALIDPTASLDWTPFRAVLENPQLLKVLHSGRQDLEIFWKYLGVLPTPLFDSQIAAMVLGLGDSRGYDHLVQHFLSETIDKKDQHSDWLVRPLTEDQLRYAVADVTYLVQLYQVLARQLEESGRYEWMSDEIALLQDVKTYQPDPKNAWKRLKSPLLKGLPNKALFLLKKLAAWREVHAQNLDLARRFVISDPLLIHTASNPFHNFEKCRIFLRQSKSPLEGLGLEESFFQALEEGQEEGGSSRDAFEKKVPLTGLAQQNFIALRALLQETAASLAIPSRLIALKEELEILAREHSIEHRIHKGWREEVFGREVSRILGG